MALKRILSGMRPTGKLHLGNLHGALGNWVELQKAVNMIVFILLPIGMPLPVNTAPRKESKINRQYGYRLASCRP